MGYSSQHWFATSKKGMSVSYLFDYVPTRGSSQCEPGSKLILSLKDPGYASRNGIDYNYVVRCFIYYAKERLGGVDCVLTVPSSSAGLRRRGIDEIAYSLNSAIGTRGSAPSLQRTRDVPSAHMSNERSTEKHLSTISVVGPSVRGKRVLLIDDVVTTGASMEACARKLKDAGARSVACLAFGATSSSSSGVKKENARRMLEKATSR